MYPVNIDWWFIHVRGYEGHWALGTLVLGFFYQRHKSLRAGYSGDWFISAYSFAIGTGIIASRLFHFLFWDTSRFFADPLIFFKPTGGFAILGGTIGTGFGGWVYCRMTRVNFLHWCDSLMTPICLTLAISRIACFLNGDAFGLPTNSIFGVIFSENSDDFMSVWRQLHPLYRDSANPLGVISQIFRGQVNLSDIPLPAVLYSLKSEGIRNLADLSRFYPPAAGANYKAMLTAKHLFPFPVIYPPVHPTQLYESFIMFVVLFLMVKFEDQNWAKRRLFFIFWFFYGGNRLFVEMFRADRNIAIGGLTYAQIISIFLIVFGSVGWLWMSMKWSKNGMPAVVLK